MNIKEVVSIDFDKEGKSYSFVMPRTTQLYEAFQAAGELLEQLKQHAIAIEKAKNVDAPVPSNEVVSSSEPNA